MTTYKPTEKSIRIPPMGVGGGFQILVSEFCWHETQSSVNQYQKGQASIRKFFETWPLQFFCS
jgi:hypothetical protein